jgi:hypothetical protein
VDDREGQVFGLGRGWLGLGPIDHDDLLRLEPHRGPRTPPVEAHGARSDERLEPRPALARQTPGEPSVEAFAVGLVAGD